MWKVRIFGQTFTLNDKQKDFYVAEVNKGAKMVVFPQFVLSSNFEYIISEEQERMEKLRSNPILNDPDFVKMIHGTYDQKSAITPVLQDRYSGPKYTLAWDEAMKNKDILPELYGQSQALEVTGDR